MTRWFLQWRHLLIFSTASCGARLDKPGINAAPVSRLLTRPGLILPALCRAFLSLAPRLSLGAGLADRIGHASRLILTLSRTPAALKEVGTRWNRQFFSLGPLFCWGRCQYGHATVPSFDPGTKTTSAFKKFQLPLRESRICFQSFWFNEMVPWI